MKSIVSRAFWNAVGCKLVEQLISVKLWVMTLASVFTWKLLGIVVEIKDVILLLAKSDPLISNESIIALLTSWSGKILDINLAFFTAVIVVILLSREVFKHSKIKLSDKDNVDKIQSEMI